jgi:hypothetical protein
MQTGGAKRLMALMTCLCKDRNGTTSFGAQSLPPFSELVSVPNPEKYAVETSIVIFLLAERIFLQI